MCGGGGDIFSGISKAVSSVVEGAGRVINGVVTSISKDPITAIAKVAAIATGQVWAIPLIDGVSTLAHGGSIGDALKVGAASAVASWVVGGLDIAGAVGGGTLGQVASQAAQGAISTGIRTGSLDQALNAAGSGAISGLIGGALANSDLGQTIGGVAGGAAGAKLVTDAVSGAANAALRGKDAAVGAGSGLAGSLFNWGANSVKDITSNANQFLNDYSANPELIEQNNQVGALGTQLEDISNQYNEINTNYQDLNTQFTAANDAYNQAVAPQRAAAEELQPQYDEAKATLQGKIDNYNNLKSQYDAAYASRNASLSQSLADQVNAAAADANNYNDTTFNDIQTQYQERVDAFNAVHEQNIDLYDNAVSLRDQTQANVDQLNDLQNQATAVSEQFNTQAQDLAQRTSEWQEQKELEALQNTRENTSTSPGNTNWLRLFGSAGNSTGATRTPVKKAVLPSAQLTSQNSGSNWGSLIPAVAATSALAMPAFASNPSANNAIPPPIQASAQNASAPQDYDLYSFLKGDTKLISNPGISSAPTQTNTSVLPPPVQAAQNMPSPNDWINDPFGYGQNANNAIPPVDSASFGLTPYAHGGSVFMSEGGQRHVASGQGDGTSDQVEAMLSSGEYVIPADCVAALGNGDNAAGAQSLDQMVQEIRSHKQENGTQLPPDAKSPLQYLGA